MQVYRQHWQLDLRWYQHTGFHTWVPKLIMLCLLGVVLLDPTLCLLDGHGPPVVAHTSVDATLDMPSIPASETPQSAPTEARLCQHAHCSILIMVVPMLIIPLARRTPIILPVYQPRFQLAAPPPLPPP